MIKGILMDYGGTIDTNGIHWARVFWGCYQQLNVEVSEQLFREAYVHGERALAKHPLVQPHHDFEAMLRIKIGCQLEYLRANGCAMNDEDSTALVQQLAALSNQFALDAVNGARPLLEALVKVYPILLVSNFYGNIHEVLKTFELTKYFQRVIESAVVGVRKPDPAIFTLGVEALGMLPADCVVIGDSYSKDIVPGCAAGCSTIWLRGEGWGDDPDNVSLANVVISNFAEIPTAIHSINGRAIQQ